MICPGRSCFLYSLIYASVYVIPRQATIVLKSLEFFLGFVQVNECEKVSSTIGDIIFLDGESDQKISSYSMIPKEFFEDVESSWKGRVKRVHLEEAYQEVEKAADALSSVVSSLDSFQQRLKATIFDLYF